MFDIVNQASKLVQMLIIIKFVHNKKKLAKQIKVIKNR